MMPHERGDTKAETTVTLLNPAWRDPGQPPPFRASLIVWARLRAVSILSRIAGSRLMTTFSSEVFSATLRDHLVGVLD